MKKSILITVLAVLPLLASCAAKVPDSAPGPTGSSSSIPVEVALGLSDSKPRFIHSNDGLQEASNQALLKGRLVTGPGNCLGVKDDENTVTIPAFPDTTVLTEANGEAPGIDIEGHKYKLGDDVKFAGGQSPITETDRKAIAECGRAIEGNSVFLIQQIAE